ncbi:protein epidermal patterning factor 2 [Phtheirospermum japonicum]|uniref:Epidermal patterning factor-like protein n=1 Tax=Phtheirospermum japonicum TaxID=374723 RepID=A0A830B1A3_9LAMI|nr:protein epidermal patterning factor 2 [Phtheirospermum japonicum]
MGMSRTNTFPTLLSLVSIFVLLLTTCKALRPYHCKHNSLFLSSKLCGGQGGEIGMELYPTGSSLPDCSHACGPCTPCRRVMVSFSKCSVESCPVIYRCMCKGKYYHVPSN